MTPRATTSFALCGDDGGLEGVESRKVYEVLPDAVANQHQQQRVVAGEAALQIGKQTPYVKAAKRVE